MEDYLKEESPSSSGFECRFTRKPLKSEIIGAEDFSMFGLAKKYTEMIEGDQFWMQRKQ